MDAILRKRSWLRWAMLLPMLTVYGEASCSTSMRDMAQSLNSAADSMDGGKSTGQKLDDLLDNIGNLFD